MNCKAPKQAIAEHGFDGVKESLDIASGWKFLPDTTRARDVEIACKFWQFVFDGSEVKFTHSIKDLSERYGVSAQEIRLIQIQAGFIQAPSTVCRECNGYVTWLPTDFHNREDFQRYVQRWRLSRCNKCQNRAEVTPRIFLNVHGVQSIQANLVHDIIETPTGSLVITILDTGHFRSFHVTESPRQIRRLIRAAKRETLREKELEEIVF